MCLNTFTSFTVLFTFAAFTEIGGWDQMMLKYPTAATNYTLADPLNYSCGMPRGDFQHIFRDPTTGDIPWTGSVFGLTVLGIVVWCSDQVHLHVANLRGSLTMKTVYVLIKICVIQLVDAIQ